MAIDKVVSASITDSAVTDAKLSFNSNQFRNIIINGDMSQAQRGTTAISSSDNIYGATDRFKHQNDSGGATSITQDTDTPTAQGFSSSMKIDVTTADASLAASDMYRIQHRIEGQNLQYLKKGTASAESLTLSFWVKSPKTGTHIVNIFDNDNSRSIAKSYTISSADTWEKKTITFAGDTTGALDNDNAGSLYIYWYLCAGSDFNSGTLATSWESNTNANLAVGQVNCLDNTANNFFLTGIQLEVGSAASDFEFLPVDVNLRRCQRYYHVVCSGTGNPICIGSMYSSSALHGVVDLPTTMRARPSIDLVTGTGYYNVYRNGGNDPFNSLVLNFSGTGVKNIINFVNESEISGTAGQAGLMVTANSASYFAVDAEL
jgi:hypothetical protein